MHRSNGLVEIKHTSRLHGNEDFVLAQQCQQVYYTYPPDNKSFEWWMVIKQLLEVIIMLTWVNLLKMKTM